MISVHGCALRASFATNRIVQYRIASQSSQGKPTVGLYHALRRFPAHDSGRSSRTYRPSHSRRGIASRTECRANRGGDRGGGFETDWMTRTDPWELLGVAEGSSADEIKVAFRAKIKNVHPDVYRGELDAQEITTRLVLAYELLLEEVENPTGGRRWRRSGSGGGFSDDEEEEDYADLWPWVNEIRCQGQSCRSSCAVTAPFLFSYTDDTERARAMSPAAFEGWSVGGEMKDRARYCVNLAVGQCPELCIHYVTSAQHAELTDKLQRVIDGVVSIQEGALDIQTYIAKSTYDNNRRPRPKRRPKAEGEYVDWY